MPGGCVDRFAAFIQEKNFCASWWIDVICNHSAHATSRRDDFLWETPLGSYSFDGLLVDWRRDCHRCYGAPPFDSFSVIGDHVEQAGCPQLYQSLRVPFLRWIYDCVSYGEMELS